jgi:hypothetical protein
MFAFKEHGVKAFQMHFTAAHLGLTRQSTRPEIIKVLSEVSEGRASCRYERDNAMVLFIGVPGIECSGAVYLYTKGDGTIWLLDFPASDDGHLTKGQCERLFEQYHLAELAYRPNLVFRPRIASTGTRRLRPGAAGN